MILLDTNVLSELMRARPAEQVISWLDRQLDSDLFYSAISRAEIDCGLALLPHGRRKKELIKASHTVIGAFEGRCLDYDCRAAAHYGEIALIAKNAGRPMSVEDMMIAAIAMTHQCRLATRNTRDFDALDRKIKICNPWDPE